MTFKEKLQIEHPGEVRNDCLGGCNGCPSYYGYEDPRSNNNSDYPCQVKIIATRERCNLCWNREIPEKEPTEAESCEWCETAGNTRMYDAEIGSSLPYKFCPMCGRKLEE